MRCLVTAGPTYAPLDQVRRLTNFSTGRLGTELANHLADAGHEVTLLLGTLATWTGPCRAHHIERFTTVDDLEQRLATRSGTGTDAVFHAAAVGDFAFGRAFTRLASGDLEPLTAGKLPTRAGPLLVELVPTPKLIAALRGWFPAAFLCGWKYEVDGSQASVIEKGHAQLRECRTDACVANGPAYGAGFALLDATGAVLAIPDANALYASLERLALLKTPAPPDARQAGR